MYARRHAYARFTVPVRLAVLAAVLATAPAGPVFAGTAPTTPTFMLTWGTPGSAGGQFTAPGALAVDAAGNVYVADTGNDRIQKFDGQGHYLTSWGSFGTGPAKFDNPTGIAVDAYDNVFVVDQGNSRVKSFTSDGVLTHQWGSPGTGAGQFSTPVGIAADAAGNVYVSDGANRIQKFTGNGDYILEWGAAGTGDGQFDGPAGIAVDGAGCIYVADGSNDRIQKFSDTGGYLAQWGASGAGAGQLDAPFGIGVDALGHVYVAELGNHRIQKFTADGVSLTMWGTLGSYIGAFDLPSGVALDASGNVFVVEINNARVQKFSGAGMGPQQAAPAFALNFGSAGSGNGQLNAPSAVTTDASGWVYVADPFNSRVQKFSGNGVYSFKFGSAGAGPGQLGFLNGVAVDAFGNIYVTCSDHRVEKFDATGAFILQWGTAGAGAGQFNIPFGIAVTAGGDVYVTDSGNDRVQKFTSTGGFVAQWGSLGAGTGQFTAPRGIAVDRAGNVYVTDGNARVQKFTSGGTFLTQWAINNSPAYSVSNVAVDAAGDVYIANGGTNSSIQKFKSDGTSITTWGAYGTGNGQFAPAYGVAVDVTGNVYVVDYNGNRVVKFVTAPAILLVSDVGNDQGRQTRLRIRGASADAPANGGVTGYAVYRGVEPLPAAAGAFDAGAASAFPVDPAAVQLAGWDYLGTQPAAGDPEYSMVVPTLADANATSTFYTRYLVRALTADPLTHYDSFPEYGYSIDNLSPPAPTPFAVAYAAGVAHLHWGVSSAADFATFRLYRGADAGFIPGSASLVASLTDTGYVDPAPAGNYYKLSAVDLNGNESAFALAGPEQTAAVDPSLPAGLALDALRPNPTAGRNLSVSFSLPVAGTARLELLDLMGRLVVRREVGTLGIGRHVVDLATGRRLPPGLYLVRLSQNRQARVARVVVTE